MSQTTSSTTNDTSTPQEAILSDEEVTTIQLTLTDVLMSCRMGVQLDNVDRLVISHRAQSAALAERDAALAFYADKLNWSFEFSRFMGVAGNARQLSDGGYVWDADNGDRARRALAAIEQETP